MEFIELFDNFYYYYYYCVTILLRYLPIAIISRIMRQALPANAKVANDAKVTVQESVSEFISFITSENP